MFNRRRMKMLVLVTLLILSDQICKLVVIAKMRLGESIDIWGSVLAFTYVQNSGAAFGILPDQKWLFILVAVIIFISISFILWFERIIGDWLQYGLILMVSGTVGNLLDRLTNNYVIDFIDFHYWPVFNLADIFICLGAGLISIVLMGIIPDGEGSQSVDDEADDTYCNGSGS